MRVLTAVAAAVGVALLAAFASFHELTDTDTWWHVAGGLTTLRTGQLPPLSSLGAHGCTDLASLDYHVAYPFFGVVYAQAGEVGLAVVRGVACVALALFVWQRLRTSTSLTFATAWASAVALCFAARVAPRAELFSYLLLVVSLLGLQAGLTPSRSARWLALPVVAAAVWPQLHSGVIFVVVAVITMGCEALVDSGRAVVGRVVGVAVFVGVAVVVGGGASLIESGFAARAVGARLAITEWQSPVTMSFHGFAQSYAAFFALALAVVVVVVVRPAGSWRGVIVGAAFLALALEAQRNIAMFAVTSWMWLPQLARASRPAVAVPVVAVPVVAAALTLQSALPSVFVVGRLVSDVSAPVSATEYARAQQLRGLVLGDYARLSYLLVGAPEVSPVWTGRQMVELGCGGAPHRRRLFS